MPKENDSQKDQLIDGLFYYASKSDNLGVFKNMIKDAIAMEIDIKSLRHCGIRPKEIDKLMSRKTQFAKGSTLLHNAKSPEIAQYLVEGQDKSLGLDINSHYPAKDGSRITPLYSAIANNRTNVALYLLSLPQLEIQKEKNDREGTVLHWAINKGMSKVVTFLLSQDPCPIDQTIRNGSGKTARDLAADTDLEKFFTPPGQSPEIHSSDPCQADSRAASSFEERF